MQNEFMLLQNILCFLSLFDLKVEERVFERNIIDVLYSKRPTILLDKEENMVGKLYVENNTIIINASIGKKRLKAVGKTLEDEDLYCFDYVITKNGKDKLSGSYKVEKNKYEKGVINNNLIDIYENNQLVLKLIFDTIRNKMKIIDIKNGIKVKYINNSFEMSKEDEEVEIKNESGYITYKLNNKNLISNEEKRGNIYGYSNITDKRDYSEIEFGLILREIYDSYFDFLEDKKTEVNDYSPYLFEKISCMSFKTLNKEKITSILGIDFNDFKGISLQKKKPGN